MAHPLEGRPEFFADVLRDTERLIAQKGEAPYRGYPITRIENPDVRKPPVLYLVAGCGFDTVEEAMRAIDAARSDEAAERAALDAPNP